MAPNYDTIFYAKITSNNTSAIAILKQQVCNIYAKKTRGYVVLCT